MRLFLQCLYGIWICCFIACWKAWINSRVNWACIWFIRVHVCAPNPCLSDCLMVLPCISRIFGLVSNSSSGHYISVLMSWGKVCLTWECDKSCRIFLESYWMVFLLQRCSGEKSWCIFPVLYRENLHFCPHSLAGLFLQALVFASFVLCKRRRG